VPDQSTYDYAVIRLVPQVQRDEFINVGVILSCLDYDYAAARIHLDESRVRALYPSVDLESVRSHLEVIPKICAGEAGAGPISLLPKRERFLMLVAPRSTIIQPSPVHTGLCTDPAETLGHLMRTMVL
jgi:hypothetical protein